MYMSQLDFVSCDSYCAFVASLHATHLGLTQTELSQDLFSLFATVIFFNFCFYRRIIPATFSLRYFC